MRKCNQLAYRYAQSVVLEEISIKIDKVTYLQGIISKKEVAQVVI